MLNLIDRFIRKNSLHLILFNLLFVLAITDTTVKHFLAWVNIAIIVAFLFFFIRQQFRSFCYRIKEAPVYTLNDKLLDAYVLLMSLVLSLLESGDLLGWMKDNLKIVLFFGVLFLLHLWDKWSDDKFFKK